MPADWNLARQFGHCFFGGHPVRSAVASLIIFLLPCNYQIGVGAEVWAFVPGVKYGSWWAAMIAVVAGIVAVIASNK